MEKQELTEAEIDEQRWEIFDKIMEINRQGQVEPQEGVEAAGG